MIRALLRLALVGLTVLFCLSLANLVIALAVPSLIGVTNGLLSVVTAITGAAATIVRAPIGAVPQASGLLPLLLLALLVLGLWAALRREPPPETARRRTTATGSYDPEESRLIQDLYRGFSRIEKRIEALETILLERRNERGL